MTRRRLDVELVRRGLVETRAAARRAIDAGSVRVGGIASPKPSTLVARSEPVDLVGPPPRYVGRGGLKLEAAFEQWPVDAHGRRAVDVGASTGGFTDCLLQRGAASVAAVDVGYGQLHPRIRNDPRVATHERTNIRLAEPGALGAPFDIVVADLSFISLATVAGPLAALGGNDTDWILLVKPQFEVGRPLVEAGGVVRSSESRAVAVRQAVSALSGHGVGARDMIVSPITGASGNVEFLVWLRPGECLLDEARIEQVAAEVPQ